MADLRKLVDDNRIVYVDPNDVRGDITARKEDQKGVPLTPDYTNFCIWCNLIVEQTSRLKNQGDYDEGVYAMAFDMSKADKGANYVSFLRGKDVDRYNFLTTDYTNIDFNEIRKRNIVEGLQIESVDISFVNYQTPQVTIKFTDLRGGGFFGREETTHNEYGKLSNLELNENGEIIDNFFSCFVTFPYPRFRLQVKGFYGKPVTFQLTCTNFSGRFNSQTGNFDITVQFIGYEYGVLGDIPFDLIVAAPMTESGRAYWDKHVADMANNGWALDKNGTEAPFLLYDFYKKVAADTQGSDDDEIDVEIVDETTDDLMKTIKLQAVQLNEIKTALSDFKNTVAKTFNSYYVTDYVSEGDNNTLGENVMVIYNTTEKYTNDNKLIELCNSYNNVNHLIANYNSQFYGNNNNTEASWYENRIRKAKQMDKINLFPGAKKSDDNTFEEWKIREITFEEFLTLNWNIKNPKEKKKPTINKSTLRDLCGNTEYTLSPSLKQKIESDLSTRNWAIYGGYGTDISFAKYAIVINIGETKKNIDNKLTELENQYELYKNKINASSDKSIRDVVGFSPYVGRYFKNVMCHLETFVNMFNECADTIEDQLKGTERTPSKLGIRDMNLETDVPSNVYNKIPPFPAVYKKYVTNEEKNEILNTGGDIKANAWIGDFVGTSEWPERKMVDELYKAAQKIAASRAEISDSQTTVHPEPGYDSLNPIDYFFGIPSYAYSSEDGAKLYMALRAEVMLNMMYGGSKVDTKEAEDLGMYDAYIFTKQTNSEEFIKTLADNNKLGSDFYNSTVYTNEFKSKEPKAFEFTKVYNDRQPVFVEENGQLKYMYMTNKEGNCEYVPLNNFNTLKSKNGFSSEYHYPKGDDFTPKDTDSDKFLVGNTGGDTSYVSSYPNTHHFEIITEESKIESIKTNYQDLKEGKFNIGGKPSSDIIGTIDKHTTLDDKKINQYLLNTPKNVYKSYSKIGINEADLRKSGDSDIAIMNKFLNEVKY